MGTFNVRLVEARELKRAHWSALSLLPGLSSARGEVSSFGCCRLAFWGDDADCDDDYGRQFDERKPSAAAAAAGAPMKKLNNDSSTSTSSSAFMPSMPPTAAPAAKSESGGDLTPFDGCLASMSSPARSPFFPAYAQSQQSNKHDQAAKVEGFKPPHETFPLPDDLKKQSVEEATATAVRTGPPPPNHYGRHEYRSSVAHNDSNPIWSDESSSNNNFSIPLRKDELYPKLQSDGCRIALEVRLEEEMAQAESLMVGGVLSNAVGAAAAATSLVPVVGKTLGEHGKSGARAGMEMMGLGTDRLIGRGYIDLMPLLMGIWEEEFDKENLRDLNIDEDDDVDEYGKMNVHSHLKKRRMERTGVLDVWVPLIREMNGEKTINGKVHLLVSYEPNGMIPKANDVVALESFARRPYTDSGPVNLGSVVTPILPPLYPLLVVDTRQGSSYLLCEYSTSRTVTSVDRNGNVKSSKWERTHRVRIHRNSAFVIERRTLLDTVGDVARMPGDIVFSTPVGREVAEASAPIVAAAGEIAAPVFIWGKLIMATGSTGIRAGLAGLTAATSIAAQAVVTGSQDKARSEKYDSRGEEGVYHYG